MRGRPSDYTVDNKPNSDAQFVHIYALCDPDTNRIRYIGKANNAETRLAQHLWYSTRRKTPLYAWILKLNRAGKKPSLQILEVVPQATWKDAEKIAIAKYRAFGCLLNIADGGDEPHCPKSIRMENGRKNAAVYWTKECRAANGRANAKAIHSDPQRKKWWNLVRSISVNLAKCYSDATMTDSLRKKTILNCMAMADLYPAKVPASWHQARWDSERLGDLSLDIIKAHMSPPLFERLGFTGVYA